MSGKYSSVESIAEALKTKEGMEPDTLMIKNAWLIKQYKDGAVLPRRQDLP